VDFRQFPVGPGDRVLDLGCGGGRHAFEVYRQGADVVAFDADHGELCGVNGMTRAMRAATEVPPGAHAGCVGGSGWVDTAVHVALFPIVVGDLYDRVRQIDQPYFQESRGKRLGTTDFASFQAKAREKGVAAFRAVLEPARRILRDQKFLAGEEPSYPDYALAGAFLWARIASPQQLLEPDDPVHAWRRAHARPVRWHGPQGEGCVTYDAVVFDLLTALLDSWTLWNDVAGSPEDGMRWRRRYLEITYGCGAYRPYETLVREAARDVGLPESLGEGLERRWGELCTLARSARCADQAGGCRWPWRPTARSGWAAKRRIAWACRSRQ